MNQNLRYFQPHYLTGRPPFDVPHHERLLKAVLDTGREGVGTTYVPGERVVSRT